MSSATLTGRESAHGVQSANGDATAADRLKSDPAYQAFWLLRVGFAALPILVGLDKFFDVLVNWEIYFAPWINDIVPGTAAEAMYAVGVIEILAGIAVALKPRYAAYVVAAWLAGDHRQPAHPLGLLRHRAAGLRAAARRARSGAACEQVRPAPVGQGLADSAPGVGLPPAPGFAGPDHESAGG